MSDIKLGKLISLILLWAAGAEAQKPAVDIRVELSLRGLKKSFRMGEAIPLVLAFTATGGKHAAVLPKPGSLFLDEVVAEPAEGAFQLPPRGGWEVLRQYSSMTTQALSRNPLRMDFYLNHWVRFDKPGRYSVCLRTRRASRVPLTTNPVVFDIVATTEVEEAAHVGRIAARLDAGPKGMTECNLVQELSFLAGNAAAEEKARRFPETDFRDELLAGLYISRNRPLVLRRLEERFLDPANPPRRFVLEALCSLRESWDGTAAEREYLGRLYDTLPQRVGANLHTATVLLVTRLRAVDAESSERVAHLRAAVFERFHDISSSDREYLLRTAWGQLRDPSAIPVLTEALAGPDRLRFAVERATALRCLLDVAPEQARLYLLAEIRDPDSLVELDLLKSLPDAELPELDEILLEQIRAASALCPRGSARLRQKATLAARYASPRILDSMRQLYQMSQANWRSEVREAFEAYFARCGRAAGF